MNLKIKINLFNADGAIFNANGPLQRQRGGFNAERATNISTPPGGIERTLGIVARHGTGRPCMNVQLKIPYVCFCMFVLVALHGMIFPKK